MNDKAENDYLEVVIDADGAIVVRGDIDIAGGPVLEAVLIANENDTSLVIDLGDVSFIDSSGLRSLLSASRRATERNTTVVLRSVGPEVARLLQITGTAGLFTLAEATDGNVTGTQDTSGTA